MTEQKDLSNNPFAALLTGDVPVSYQNTKEDQEVPTSQPGYNVKVILHQFWVKKFFP
jgi:hypothetical protein